MAKGPSRFADPRAKGEAEGPFRRVPRLGWQDARPTLPGKVPPRAAAHLTFCRGEFQEPFLLP
jgi:hypothetical protein